MLWRSFSRKEASAVVHSAQVRWGLIRGVILLWSAGKRRIAVVGGRAWSKERTRKPLARIAAAIGALSDRRGSERVNNRIIWMIVSC